MAKRINCLKCKYYLVTWDSQRPRGCKYFGFKGKELPSVVVKRNSGQECHAFEEKIVDKRK